MAKKILDDCGGRGCRIKAPASHRVVLHPSPTRFAFDYTTKSLPCQQKRTGCPVQLLFDRGQPKVRFCKRAGNKQPGYTIAVRSAEEAQRISSEACACWKASGPVPKKAVKAKNGRPAVPGETDTRNFDRCAAVTSRALGSYRR